MPQPVVSFEINDHDILKKQDYVVSKRDHLNEKIGEIVVNLKFPELPPINFHKYLFTLY